MKLQRLLISAAAAVLGSVAFAVPTGSSFDTTKIVSAISGVSTPIVSIGGALFGIYALILAFKKIKSMTNSG